MKAGTRREVSIHIAASPEEVYGLVSDVRRMGEWSPECRHAEWIGDATGPVVGARFRAANRRGVARWSNSPRVVAADAGREFAFVAGYFGREMTKWTYRFLPAAGGTEVAESFEMLQDRPWYLALSSATLMGVQDRAADLEAGMTETLRRLKAAVESNPPGAGSPNG